MFRWLTSEHSRPGAHRSRLGLESLESREVLSAAPTFTVTPAASTEIDVKWSGTGAAGYDVVEWVTDHWTQVGFYGANTTWASVTGLAPGSYHIYDVVAYDPTSAQPWTWGGAKGVYTPNWIIDTPGQAFDHPKAGGAYAPVDLPLFGPNGPNCLDVQQGGLSDSWLLASLAEVAARNPDLIQNMFTALGSTTENGAKVELYNVHLYAYGSGTIHDVAVDTELPGGGTEYARTNGCLWVALAEKAYAEANGAGIVYSHSPHLNSYEALAAGNPADALQTIAGVSAMNYAFAPQLGDSLTGANQSLDITWSEGVYIVPVTGAVPADQILAGSHSYALVGYDPSNQTFTLFDPSWAAEGKTSGLFNPDSTFLSQNNILLSIGGYV